MDVCVWIDEVMVSGGGGLGVFFFRFFCGCAFLLWRSRALLGWDVL
jgi:hypothetical protein